MTKEQIHLICKQYGIDNYTINSDMSIDVDGDVNFFRKNLQKLPLKFRKVSNNFYCGFNKLTSLEGCPVEVNGRFNCFHNQLTTLEGSPIEVGGDFSCSYNQLTSLEGCPIKVGGNFHCSYNQLTSLEGGPKFIGAGLYCNYNPIYEEFLNKFNNDYNLYRKYLHRQKLLKQLIND